MSTPEEGRSRTDFGRRRLTGAERATLATLRAEGGCAAASVADASHSLLAGLLQRDEPGLLFSFCQLNHDEVRDELTRVCRREFVPARVEPLVAEVLGETLDAARCSGAAGREYAAIARRCRRVVAQLVDECVGFVPSAASESLVDRFATSLAERLEVPDELLLACGAELHSPLARILVAQTLLLLPRDERRRLLAGEPAGSSRATAIAATPSIAHLLSRDAALARLRNEYEHAIAWLRATDAAASQHIDRSRP